jgi:hypothetical protein
MLKAPWVLTLTFGVVIGATPVAAQSSARSSITVDAALGSGRGHGGEYRDRSLFGARLALSIRRWHSPQSALFAEAAWDWLGWTRGHFLVCYPSSRGGCVPSYPELSGPTIIAGVATDAWNHRIEGRAAVGGGAYRAAPGPRVGAAIVQADAAWLPLRHVGLVVGARWILLPRYRGDKLTIIPWNVGLRIR